METLQGKRTYIIAALAAIVTLVKYLGYIDEDLFQMLLGLLGAGGVATMAAKVNRIDKKMILVLFLLLIPVGLSAQATPISKLAWDMNAPTLADANGYTYKYYPDNATTGIALTAVTCTGTASPFQCEVSYPAFTPGSHTLFLTATNIAGESPKQTSPFAFVFVVTPGTPFNIHTK